MPISVNLAHFDPADTTYAPQPTAPATKSGGWADWLPTIGSVIGSVGGGLLTAGLGGEFAGGAGGGALGEALKNKIEGKTNTIANVGGQALLGGAGSLVGAGLGAVGKAIGVVGRGGAEAAGELASKAGSTIAANTADNLGSKVAQKAVTTLIKPSATLSGDALEAGISIPKTYLQNQAILGTDVKTMVPKINNLLSEQEARITSISDANATKMLSGDSVVKALEEQKLNLSKNLGNQEKITALDAVINEAKAKYASGISVGDARDIVRNANMQFGKSIIQDTKGAIVSSAQKIEANALNSTLKTTYPEIADALKQEQGLIMLRSAVDKQAGKVIAGDGLPVDLNPLDIPKGIAAKTVGRPGVLGKVAEIGTNMSRPLSTAATIGTQYVGQSGVHSLASSLTANPSDSISSATPATSLPSTPPQQPDNSNGMTPESIQKAMLWDIQNNGGKGLTDITALAKANGVDTTGGTLSTSAQKNHDSISNGLSALDSVEANLTAGGGAKGLEGLATNIPLLGQYINPNGKAYEATKVDTATQIAKAITGGVARGSMVEHYMNSLPSVTDTPQVAAQKIAMIRTDMLKAASNYGFNDILQMYQGN